LTGRHLQTRMIGRDLARLRRQLATGVGFRRAVVLERFLRVDRERDLVRIGLQSARRSACATDRCCHPAHPCSRHCVAPPDDACPCAPDRRWYRRRTNRSAGRRASPAIASARPAGRQAAVPERVTTCRTARQRDWFSTCLTALRGVVSSVMTGAHLTPDGRNLFLTPQRGPGSATVHFRWGRSRPMPVSPQPASSGARHDRWAC
jgi:hypothetical protein